MKKIIISCIVIVIFLLSSSVSVYADNKSGKDKNKQDTEANEQVTESNWVSKAFSAAYSFLTEKNTKDPLGGTLVTLLDFFTNIVRAINIILLVLLAGLSMISLSLVGVRYLLSGADPNQKVVAKNSLHTVFIGMTYGFGAFVIWNIAMSIVQIIVGALAQE